jgi:hypothetical protein
MIVPCFNFQVGLMQCLARHRVPSWLRLVLVVGGSACPEDAIASAPGTTVRPGRGGELRGRHGYRLVGAGASTRAGARSSSSADTTTDRWGRRAVVTWQLLIGLFELKFDRLNTNLTI